MAKFYRYHIRDFAAIPAHTLQERNKIAYGYGGDGKYGAIPIEEISKSAAGILLHYTLPIGALAQSNTTVSIAVYWKGRIPEIAISQDVNVHDRILILRE